MINKTERNLLFLEIIWKLNSESELSVYIYEFAVTFITPLNSRVQECVTHFTVSLNVLVHLLLVH